MSVLAYIVRANRNEPAFLCVVDSEKGESHSFEISAPVAARLAAECADLVNVHLGGLDKQAAHEEITLLWSRRNVAPSDP